VSRKQFERKWFRMFTDGLEIRAVGECDKGYLLTEIKNRADKIYNLDDNNILCLRVELPFDDDKKDLKDASIQWGMFTFGQEEIGKPETAVWCKIFEGSGPTGSLKEFRHNWFGQDEDGYVFYLPIKATIKALEILNEYFDD